MSREQMLASQTTMQSRKKRPRVEDDDELYV